MTNIAAYIEQVARHYWGEPNPRLSKGTEIRWGNNGSKSIDVRKGVWTDFETGESGGVVALVKANEPASINGNIPDVLEKKFGISKQQQKALPVVPSLARSYDYYNSDGVLAYQVLRFDNPKTFRQRRPDDRGGWINSIKDIEALPYNLPAIIQNPTAPVFIVEGEKCADALIELGLIATTNSGGSKNWKPELAQYFADRNVVVLPDNDEAGQAHADTVIAALYGTVDKIKRLDLPGLPPKGDVADWLASGNAKKTLLALAKQAPVVEVAPEPKPDVFETYNLDYLKNMPPVEWLLDGILTRHGFAVLYGQPGIGKSFMSIDWALSIAYGREWHGRQTKQNAVLYLAAEGVGGLGKRIRAWQAHYDRYGDAPFYVLPMAVKMLDQQELDKLIRTIDNFKQEFSLIVIDTVARTLASTGSDENDATAMGQFGEMCGVIQRHADCAVLAVHHSGKDAARGMRGSSSLMGLSDTVLALSSSEGRVTLKMEKQKDAEPIADEQYELTPVALIDDSSAVLLPVEMADKKRGAKLTPGQLLALQALQNGLIDAGVQQMSLDRWKDLHKQKCDDFTSRKRSDDRAALQLKGVVIIDGGKVWINKELGENVR
jgi:hypothetical protein